MQSHLLHPQQREMAGTSSSRAHLINQLSRRATNSPREEDFVTASSASFDAARDAIHSTAQFDYTTQQQLPQHPQPYQYNQAMDHVSEAGSDRSADMSIELGRGVERGARDRDDDVSSNVVFNMGNDSLYELTTTPPLRPREDQKKTNPPKTIINMGNDSLYELTTSPPLGPRGSQKPTESGMKKQASVRRSTETAKTNQAATRSASTKHRSLSEATNNVGKDDDVSFTMEDAAQPTPTFNTRNTRFARSRQTSGFDPAAASRGMPSRSQQATLKAGGNNPTAQSNSFMLPNLPNINELVSGIRKDGTAVFNRNTKSQSRFTSGSYKPTKPTPQQHQPIDNVPVPDEEKAIYASLQLLKDRVDQLEMEKSEAHKRAEEYESEIIDLRSQLTVIQRRPDSALGSDEESSAHEKLSQEKKRLQASSKALQERLDRSERRISVSEIAVKRVTNERDELVAQIGVAYYNNEELKAENESFKESCSGLQLENQDLKAEIDALRRDSQDLRALMAQNQASFDEDKAQRDKREAGLRSKLEENSRNVQQTNNVESELWTAKDRSQSILNGAVKSRKEGRTAPQADREERLRSTDALNETTTDDLAARIAKEVQKNREASANSKVSANDRINHHRQANGSRSGSKSTRRQQSVETERLSSAAKRTPSAPAESENGDADSTTQLDFSQKPRDMAKRASLPPPIKPSGRIIREGDTDLTLLSLQDSSEVQSMRKKLEEERRAGRFNRAASAPTEHDTTQRSTQSLPRKSSLKDVTTGADDATGRFSATGSNLDTVLRVTKSVRVQSPHTSDEHVINDVPSQSEAGDDSFLTNTSNTSRRRRRAASAEGMTSEFIVPDITLRTNQSVSQAGSKTTIKHDFSNCTACPPPGKDVNIPVPIPVTDRDVDVTDATIRPAQAPPVALATVIKQLKDEITHLKYRLAAQQRLYHQHDPALSKRRRLEAKALINKYMSDIEKRSDQVYALYDVLEGQKQAAAEAEKTGIQANVMDEQEVEETLSSLGIDPVELSGRVGRSAAPFGLDGMDELSGEPSEELPWEGLSDEEEVAQPERRRSGVY